MRGFFYILITICILLPQIVFAHNHIDMDKWNELNQTSDKVLQLVKQQKFSDAKQLLDYFSEQFLFISKEHATLSMTELRVITTSYEKAQEAVTNVQLPLEERIMKVTQLRLVIDAVSNKHHPLWLNTKNSLLTSIDHLQQLTKNGDRQAYEHRFNTFLNQYHMIRPALLISLDATQFQKIDSQVQFLDRNRAVEQNREKLSNHLQFMHTEFEKLFNQVVESEADPSLLWVMFSIGGMIFVSLSYVGWKKYQGEKRKRQLRQRASRK